MKVIDLLQRIANGEEVPEKIKFHDLEFKFRNKGYYCELEDKFEPLGSIYILDLMLKDKVEVIEDKKIKKICTFPGLDDDEYAYEDGNRPGNVLIHNEIEKMLINKINEIIDKLEDIK